MAPPVTIHDYPELEERISAYLARLWDAQVEPLMPHIIAAYEAGDMVKVDQLVRGIDVQSIAQQADKYLRAHVLAALSFGAMHASGKTKIVYHDRRLPPVEEAAVASFPVMVQAAVHRAADLLHAMKVSKADLSPAQEDHDCDHHLLHKVMETILKAEKLTNAQKINAVVMGQARSAIDVAANVTTSRLVSLGFVDQMTSQGVDQYQIDAVLDGRTCPVCRSLNGRTFSVASARDQLLSSLMTTDVDTLKQIMPWPSQSKASVAQIRSMSDSDLQTAGIQSPPFHAGCYAEGTKVYTKRGFVDFRDLDIDTDMFLSMGATGQVEWVRAVAEVAYDVDKVVVGKTGWRTTEMVVSENHPMFYARRVRGSHNESRYEYRRGSLNDFSSSAEHYIVKSSRHEGSSPEKVEVAGRSYRLEPLLKFLGYFLSEGHVHPRVNCYPTISQAKHFDKMAADLVCLGPQLTVWGDKLVVLDRQLGEWCKQFGKAHEKFVPDFIKELSREHIRMFLDAYALGDGSVRSGECYGSKYEAMAIYTSSVRMRDDLAELMIRAGYGARYTLDKPAGLVTRHRNGEYASNHDTWVVSRLNTVRRHMKLETVERKTRVYDVELEKNHTLLISTDGAIHWGSNCRCMMVKVGTVTQTFAVPGAAEEATGDLTPLGVTSDQLATMPRDKVTQLVTSHLGDTWVNADGETVAKTPLPVATKATQKSLASILKKVADKPALLAKHTIKEAVIHSGLVSTTETTVQPSEVASYIVDQSAEGIVLYRIDGKYVMRTDSEKAVAAFLAGETIVATIEDLDAIKLLLELGE